MENIFRNIDKDSNGCWVWNKSISGSGYGQLTVSGRYWAAHRYAYTVFLGKIPKGILVRHSCHNPRCCNPKHLSLGTDKDNYRDSLETHQAANKLKSDTWCIDGDIYNSAKDALIRTGLSPNTLVKYTNKDTRVFDTLSYRRGCLVANKIPKV